MTIPKTWLEIRTQYIVYEDQNLLAMNKPVGMSVVGDSEEPDIVTLAKLAGENLLPVHRIDKVTSGLIVFAKSPSIHAELTKQFNKRTVKKSYLTIVASTTLPESGIIDLPLSIGRKNSVRVAADREHIQFDNKKNIWSISASDTFSDKKIYPSITCFEKIFEDKQYTILVVNPITGRRHQIRVHLAWIGYPIVGDPLFTNQPKTCTFLHSWKLAFTATWDNDKRIELEAVPREDFWELLSHDFLEKKLSILSRAS